MLQNCSRDTDERKSHRGTEHGKGGRGGSGRGAFASLLSMGQAANDEELLEMPTIMAPLPAVAAPEEQTSRPPADSKQSHERSNSLTDRDNHSRTLTFCGCDSMSSARTSRQSSKVQVSFPQEALRPAASSTARRLTQPCPRPPSRSGRLVRWTPQGPRRT